MYNRPLNISQNWHNSF